MINPEILAQQKFDNVLKTINSLLIKNEQINIEKLQKIYIKLKRKDQRVIGTLGLPLIGNIAQSGFSHDFSKSDDILKIAKLMDTLGLKYIDIEIYKGLKDQQDELYSTYFKEYYETEIKAQNQTTEALDILYNQELEKE